MLRTINLLILGCALWGLFLVAGTQPTAWAQDKNPQVAPEAQPKSDAPAQSESYLRWVVRSSGWVGLCILMLSVYFVAKVIQLYLEVRPDIAAPPDLIRNCEELLERNDIAAVYTAARNDDSFLGRVLATGLTELSSGMSEAREAMDRMGESETVQLEKQISMLAVLGTLGPMIGLIGTLQGMIASFSVIARSDVQLKPSEVADGISTALVLTWEGVFLSIFAIAFFAVFRNRVATISAATMMYADQLLRHVGRILRNPNPQPAASHGSPPPAAEQTRGAKSR